MNLPRIPPADQTENDADFCRRWPPDKYPGLHLPPEDFFALKHRRRRRALFRRLLRAEGPRFLAAELPSAHQFLHSTEGTRNGKSNDRR